MTTFTSLGAINKLTGDYVYPRIANKEDPYICPDCSKDLIFCKGAIRTPYFRHKKETGNPCVRYSTPSESQVHKDCKLQLKTLLENKTPLTFVRKCCDCGEEETFDIPEVAENSSIHLEYRFDYQGPKVADVAYVDDGAILCIFEVRHTHRTREEARPEPWFELDAESFIASVNETLSDPLKIPCLRDKLCSSCASLAQDEKQRRMKKERQDFSLKVNAISRIIFRETTSYEISTLQTDHCFLFEARTKDKNVYVFVFDYSQTQYPITPYVYNSRILPLHQSGKLVKVYGYSSLPPDAGLIKQARCIELIQTYRIISLGKTNVYEISWRSRTYRKELEPFWMVDSTFDVEMKASSNYSIFERAVTCYYTPLLSDIYESSRARVCSEAEPSEYYRALEVQTKLINAGIRYDIDFIGVCIIHPITGSSIRRTLISGETLYKGKWTKYLSLEGIISWYKGENDDTLLRAL